MKKTVFLLALFLAGGGGESANPNPVKAFTWKLNPEEDLVIAYQIWMAKSSGNKLIATVPGPPFKPGQHGTYFLKAVNLRGISDKGGGLKD